MTFTRSFRFGRGPALALTFWLATGASPVPWAGAVATAEPQGQAAGEGAKTPAPEGLGVVRGLLFKEDEVTRLAGATVTAVNVQTGRRYVSNHTGENGAYEVLSLPAGTYDLVIDSAGRIYVTEALVDLAES